MSTETAIKTKLNPGTRVRITQPREINQNLKGQILEVVEMTTDEAFKVYRNDAATDWELISSGEKFARPTWILERSEVEVYSAGFPSPALVYREGDRVVENLTTENVQLDSLIRHGTFINYRHMDGAGKSLYPFVRWDDGSEGYSNEDTLERSDKPAPMAEEQEEAIALKEFDGEIVISASASPKDIEKWGKTYSADKLTNNKIRGFFEFQGRKWVCISGAMLKGPLAGLKATEIVKPEQYQGPLPTHDYANQPEGIRFTYCGQLVTHGRDRYVLTQYELHLKITSPTEPETVTPVEIIPSDPSELLSHCEADIEQGMSLMAQGKELLWRGIAQICNERLWEAKGYESEKAYFDEKWVGKWKKSSVYNEIRAGKTRAELEAAGIPAEALPTSTDAMLAIAQVPESDRVEVLERAIQDSGKPTAKAIRQAAAPLPKAAEFDEAPDGEAEELPVYRPDSSPEAIREGLEQGYIIPTDDAEILYSAEGVALVPGDCIALASTPTKLLGEISDYTTAGRIEYTRFGKKLYIDPQLCVHQRPIDLSAAKAAAPTGKDVQTTAEPPEAVTGDFEGLFETGQLARWNRRFWVIGRVESYGIQLLGFTPETLSNWVNPEEVKLSAAEDPLGLTLESSCQSILSELVEAFGKELVQQTLETLEE